MEPEPLSIRLFGGLEVRIRGQPLPRVRTHSVHWLLVLLVMRPGRPVPRAWLAGTLWPQSSREQSLLNLRCSLLELRRALGPEAARLGAPTRDTLLLDLDGADADLPHFDAAIAAGEEASLKQAVALYRGPLLEGCVEEWVLPEQVARAEACLQALETLADRAGERGESSAALDYLNQAERLDPLRDSVQRRRMQALAALGDLPAALLGFRDFRLRLHAELNLEPDPETIRIFQELRAGVRRSALPRPAVAPSPRSPATSSTISGEPARLPIPLTALIGRKQAVREVCDCLRAARLVTMVGGGGVGKTRLALQVAEELAGQFPEGAVFVELAPLADPALLTSFVAAALGLRETATSGSLDLLQSLVGWLTLHPLLLVLDNCEHLIEAVADLTHTLLERCPELRILATSRQRLGLTGEIAWRVPSLSAPDPDRLPPDDRCAVEELPQYPAAQLFLERAGMARPGFRLGGRAEAVAVARICQRLDGIPLALELAAARVMVLSVAQIASRLDDRFHLLTGGSRAALPRHRTLQALIDWSYHLLTEEEQALLRQLSVCAGGWALEAAEALEGTLDLLSSLEEKSLVLVEEREGELRYRMLETVREYAREKLGQSGEAAAARRRHAQYFLTLAEQVFAEPTEEARIVGLDRLEREHDNLRAALDWCLAEGELELGLALGALLGRFWQPRCYLSEGRARLMGLLEAVRRPAAGGRPDRCGQGATAAPDTAKRSWRLASPESKTALVWVLGGAGRMASLQGDLAAARPLLEESLSLARATGDRELIANALRSMALVQPDPQAKRELYEESLALYRELGQHRDAVGLLVHLGTICCQHDMERARALFEEALSNFRQLDDRPGVAWTLVHLGNLRYYRGDYTAVRAHAEESMALFHTLLNRMGIACSLNQLGVVALAEDRPDEAGGFHQQALQIAEEIGSQQDVAGTLACLGNVALAQGDRENAANLYERAIEIFRAQGNRENIVWALLGLGRVMEQQGESDRAKELFTESLALGQERQSLLMAVGGLEGLARVAAAGARGAGGGDTERAARLMGAAAAHRQALGAPLPPPQREEHERAVAAVREALGEAAFTAAWEAGRGLSWPQAAALALDRQ